MEGESSAQDTVVRIVTGCTGESFYSMYALMFMIVCSLLLNPVTINVLKGGTSRLAIWSMMYVTALDICTNAISLWILSAQMRRNMAEESNASEGIVGISQFNLQQLHLINIVNEGGRNITGASNVIPHWPEKNFPQIVAKSLLGAIGGSQLWTLTTTKKNTTYGWIRNNFASLGKRLLLVLTPYVIQVVASLFISDIFASFMPATSNYQMLKNICQIAIVVLYWLIPTTILCVTTLARCTDDRTIEEGGDPTSVRMRKGWKRIHERICPSAFLLRRRTDLYPKVLAIWNKSTFWVLSASLWLASLAWLPFYLPLLLAPDDAIHPSALLLINLSTVLRPLVLFCCIVKFRENVMVTLASWRVSCQKALSRQKRRPRKISSFGVELRVMELANPIPTPLRPRDPVVREDRQSSPAVLSLRPALEWPLIKVKPAAWKEGPPPSDPTARRTNEKKLRIPSTPNLSD